MINDPVFILSIKNTIIFTIISVPLTLALSLFLAIQLTRKSKLNTIFRTVYFLPYITTITAIAVVWIWIFHPQGLVNGFLLLVGIKDPPFWLLDGDFVIYALSIIQAWRSLGYAMLIYIAGLQNIPADLYESAYIDGAGGIKKFIHITWPMLTPTTFFLVITSLLFTFQAFDVIYAVTDGGPGTSSHVLAYYIYKTGFKFFRMGYSSALAIVMSLIIIIITIIQWKGQKNWVNE
jgi:multiple sugar transport system permease protein